MNNFKKDTIFSLICGEVTAWFLIFIIKNPYIKEFAALAKIENMAWYLIIALPIVFFLGVLVGNLIAKLSKTIYQAVKFLEVGVLNTFIDIGILNLLVWQTGITAGGYLAPLNTVSFLFAATNSYYWNKFWTFKSGGGTKSKEFLQFLIISFLGWGINTGIVVLGTMHFAAASVLSAGALVNVVKLVATFVSMVWNFIGYKFIVFKS